MGTKIRILAIILIIALPSAGRDRVTLQKVSDGDTIIVNLNGRPAKVRLIGIDAPESSKNRRTKYQSKRTGGDTKRIVLQGKKATLFVKSIIKRGDTLLLEYDAEKFDRYGRTLAYAWLTDGRMLNEIIIGSGYAYPLTIPPNVRYKNRFLEAYKKARSSGMGLWSGED